MFHKPQRRGFKWRKESWDYEADDPEVDGANAQNNFSSESREKFIIEISQFRKALCRLKNVDFNRADYGLSDGTYGDLISRPFLNFSTSGLEGASQGRHRPVYLTVGKRYIAMPPKRSPSFSASPFPSSSSPAKLRRWLNLFYLASVEIYWWIKSALWLE